MTPIRLLREAEKFISQHPLAAHIERGDVRIRSISRFPYRIYYRVRPEEIIVKDEKIEFVQQLWNRIAQGCDTFRSLNPATEDNDRNDTVDRVSVLRLRQEYRP
jgi:hypothetical protein